MSIGCRGANPPCVVRSSGVSCTTSRARIADTGAGGSCVPAGAGSSSADASAEESGASVGSASHDPDECDDEWYDAGEGSGPAPTSPTTAAADDNRSDEMRA